MTTGGVIADTQQAAAALTTLSAENAALKAQVAELTRQKQAIALDALAASGQAQEAYEAQLAAEAKVARLDGALNNIRELNMTGADENGQRWAHSDLIEHEIFAALTEGDTNG
jgi:hypothetical protein